MLHRTRHLYIRQQTAVGNTIRAHGRVGIVAPVGRNGGVPLRKSRIKGTSVSPKLRACLSKPRGSRRLGDWGSEVQILSLRPITRFFSTACHRPLAFGRGLACPGTPGDKASNRLRRIIKVITGGGYLTVKVTLHIMGQNEPYLLCVTVI
jgi:hypothetical protein